MARKHYGKAQVTEANIQYDKWMDTLRDGNEGIVSSNHLHRIAKSITQKCDPSQYLLSHATIVSSVDVYQPRGVKLGKSKIHGQEIDVRFPDFRVTPNTHKFINNNLDAFSRGVVLTTYKTFVGAQNYLEHIQVPELSKGFIVDAIARDLGDTVYIDILVATSRIHTKLIQDILSGKMNSMSMGCHLAGTLVTLGDGSVLPIEEIRPDMEVVTQKGNICKVHNLQIRSNRWKMLEIKASGLPTIHSTDNHGYYVVPSNSVKYRKKNIPEFLPYGFEKIDAGDIKVGDIIATPIPQNQVKPNYSISEARFLGFWVGDGWKFDLKHDSTVGVGICCDEKYPDIAENISLIMDQMCFSSGETRMKLTGTGGTDEFFSRTEFIRANQERTGESFRSLCDRAGVSRRTGYNWVHSYENLGDSFLDDPRHGPKKTSSSVHDSAFYLRNTSRYIREVVDTCTSGRTAKEKLIGPDVMAWPVDHQLSFLSGVIDSDGCVSRRKNGSYQVHISSRNLNLIKQYQTMLSRCGIISTLSSAKRGGTKFVPSGAGVDYQLRIRNDGALKIPSLKIQKFADKIRSSSANSDRWITKDYLYSRVKSIRSYDYDGMVYDLQVDQDHSYVANGIGVSNCISLFTVCSKCGNVASDDATICPCISYIGKGTKFQDEDGIEHPVCELIGHSSVPNSNQFIEASWVGNPAFSGATRRNLLNPESKVTPDSLTSAKLSSQVRLQELPDLGSVWSQTASSIRTADEEEEPGPSESSDNDTDSPDNNEQDSSIEDSDSSSSDLAGNSIEKLVNEARDALTHKLLQSILDNLGPKPEDVSSVSPSAPINLESGNDNLQHASSFQTKLSKFTSDKSVQQRATRIHSRVASGDLNDVTFKDFVFYNYVKMAMLGRKPNVKVFAAIGELGDARAFPSETSYLACVEKRIARKLTDSERQSVQICVRSMLRSDR